MIAQRDARELAGETFDAIVIGAGPAGSIAALNLAEAGAKTLLIDRHRFPREKVCGDGLIPDSLAVLRRNGLYEAVKARAFAGTRLSVFSPSQIEIDVETEFMTIKRIELDAILASCAIERGAVLARGSVRRLTSHDSGVVAQLDDGTALGAGAGIIATGADTTLASSSGFGDNSRPTSIAMRCYVASPVRQESLVVSFDRSILPGYGWIFPLRNGEFNVGVGVTLARRAAVPDLRVAFRSWCDRFPPAREIVRSATSATDLRGATLRCSFEGVAPDFSTRSTFVAGEAIGTTLPLTGEGIGKAMETGELAAKLALRHLAGDEVGGEYQRTIDSSFRPRYAGYQFAERWFSTALLTDFVAWRVTRSPWMREALSGMIDESVDAREIISLRGAIRSFIS